MQDIWLRTAEVKLNLELIQNSDPELVVSMFPTLPHGRTVNLQQGWPECYLVFYWAGLQDTPWLQWEFYEDRTCFSSGSCILSPGNPQQRLHYLSLPQFLLITNHTCLITNPKWVSLDSKARKEENKRLKLFTCHFTRVQPDKLQVGTDEAWVFK